MNVFWALILLLKLASTTKVVAQLNLIQYSPLTFNLSFTKPVQLPVFQLQINGKVLTYKVTNSNGSVPSSYFMIESSLDGVDTSTSTAESFGLIFNEPLSIANSTLTQASYFLSARKTPEYLEIPNWLGILLVVICFVCVPIRNAGLWLVQFFQIYLLADIKFNYKTSIVEEPAKFFLFSLAASPDEPYTSNQLNNMMWCFLVVIIIFLPCLLIKVLTTNRSERWAKAINRYFVYSFFLYMWTVFQLPSMYNSMRFLYTSKGQMKLSASEYAGAVALTYLSILSSLTLFFLQIMMSNPRIGQTSKSWLMMVTKQNSQEFKVFHRDLSTEKWYQRSFAAFLTFKKVVVLILWFEVGDLFMYVLCGVQLFHLFYLFVAHPYRSKFYGNMSLIVELVIFIFFAASLEGALFINMSIVLITEKLVKTYLICRIVTFFLIFAGLVAICMYELYSRIVKFKKIVNGTNEEKDYSQHIKTQQESIIKEKTSSMSTRRKSSIPKDSRPRVQSKRKRKQSPLSPTKKQQAFNLFEIEMENLSTGPLKDESVKDREYLLRTSEPEVNVPIKKKKKKWNDKCLLEEMIEK